jgi:hypothetical protein
LRVLCVVRYKSLRRADQSSRGVLPSVVYLRVIMNPRYEKALAHWRLLRHGNNNSVRGSRCNYSPRAPIRPIGAAAYGQLSLSTGAHESMATFLDRP